MFIHADLVRLHNADAFFNCRMLQTLSCLHSKCTLPAYQKPRPIGFTMPNLPDTCCLKDAESRTVLHCDKADKMIWNHLTPN